MRTFGHHLEVMLTYSWKPEPESGPALQRTECVTVHAPPEQLTICCQLDDVREWMLAPLSEHLQRKVVLECK